MHNDLVLGKGGDDGHDEFVVVAREMLLHFGKTARPDIPACTAVLDKLSDRILWLNEEGFSSRQIAEFLDRCGVDVAPGDIEKYCQRQQAKRLSSCEETMSRFYNARWNDTVQRSAAIEQGLRRSLEEGRGLVVHYQPQIDMRSGQVVGAEALVRWNYEGALIPPSEFIPLAEKSDLIVLIGETVLREACREAKKWQATENGREKGIKVGVNLSMRQVSPRLPYLVNDVLCDTGLSSELLNLEITESILAANDSIPVLHSLRESGVGLSIDDFGTGYSCLAQLKDLPVDTIKIDQAFVRGLGQDQKANAMVEAIVDIAHRFDMATLAEGVESIEQVRVLKKYGCLVGQGFLYSMPLAAGKFSQFVSCERVA